MRQIDWSQPGPWVVASLAGIAVLTVFVVGARKWIRAKGVKFHWRFPFMSIGNVPTPPPEVQRVSAALDVYKQQFQALAGAKDRLAQADLDLLTAQATITKCQQEHAAAKTLHDSVLGQLNSALATLNEASQAMIGAVHH
jgi:hypothetical protein